jgi:hypothetical protein
MKKIQSLALAGLFLLSATRSGAGTLTETFSADPQQHGWCIFGDTNLFRWDSTQQNLAVTWDSSQPNSYFYHPLGTVLARDDDFSIGFDLRLDQIGPGPDTNKPYSFSLGIGFLNLGEAVQPGFLRGTGYSSPDLVELAYFWDSGYGATFWPTFVDQDSTFNYLGDGTDYAIYELALSNWYRVVMNYAASNQAMVTTLTNLQTGFGLMVTNTFATNFTDFRVDTLSISSYNDTDGYGGSLAATGAVANITVILPPPPVANLVGALTQGVWRASFTARTNWLYTLERTSDFHSWTAASPTTPAAGGQQVLSDTNPPPNRAFYRIRANRP